MGAGILGDGIPAFAGKSRPASLTQGDAPSCVSSPPRKSSKPIFGMQYTELGGTQDNEESSTEAPAYIRPETLDGDMLAIHSRQH